MKNVNTVLLNGKIFLQNGKKNADSPLTKRAKKFTIIIMLYDKSEPIGTAGGLRCGMCSW